MATSFQEPSTSSEAAEFLAMTNSLKLPEEMLRFIYKNVLESEGPDEDEESKSFETLLSCRMVCLDWKNAVDGYKEFMQNRCWWRVASIPQFLASTIATKVKSLCFVGDLLAEQVDQYLLDKFFNEIIPKIKLFVFDFNEEEDEEDELVEAGKRQQLLYSKLINSAKDLEEIRIMESCRRILKPFNADQIESVGSKLKCCSLNIEDLQEKEMTILREFILSMPNLSELVLFYVNRGGVEYLMELLLAKEVIIPHIEAFPGKLKDVLFDFDLEDPTYHPGVMIVLTVAAVTSDLNINFHDQFVEVADVFQRLQDVVVNEHNCRSIKTGVVSLKPPPDDYSLETLRNIGLCTQIKDLQITFQNAICENSELDFLPKLRNLNRLVFVAGNQGLPAGVGLGIVFPDLVFLPGMPSLRTLILHVNICASYANFHLYFPYLECLELHNLNNLPDNLLVLLSGMEKLTGLNMRSCQITDGMFTQLQVNDDGSIPAIATFKNLKSLTLCHCDLLTDVCLTDGIQHNTTLENLTLVSTGNDLGVNDNPQFTDVGLDAIKNSGRIKLTSR